MNIYDVFLPAPAGTIAVTIMVLYVVYTRMRRESPVRQLPLPSGREWIWGHERIVFVNEPGLAIRKWIKQCGLTFRIKAAFNAPDILVLSDPGGIAYLLQKRIYDYHHSEVVRPRVSRLLGKGLGWVEGEVEHKKMRHMTSASFSHEGIKAMSQELADAVTQVIDDLTAQVQTRGEGCLVNTIDWTSKATLNVIGRLGFLHDFEGGNSHDARLILNARRRGVSPVVQYAGFLTLMLLRRFPILNKLPIDAIQAQGLAKLTIQRGVAQEMIRRNQDLTTSGQTAKQKDLLTRLLAHDEGKISREELLEQISTFVISGHETTTQALGFTMFELARRPDVQQRLRDELRILEHEPTYEDYQTQTRLPYLDAVCKETMRLYPGLPYMERVATKPDTIPLREPVTLPSGSVLTELPVTAGQVVLIPIIAIHRLDCVWSDPDTFRPERWFDDLPPRENLCSGWANMLTFSDGPRSCPGMRLAIYEYKLILTKLLSRFELVDSGASIVLKIASSLQAWDTNAMENGPCLPVRLKLL